MNQSISRRRSILYQRSGLLAASGLSTSKFIIFEVEDVLVEGLLAARGVLLGLEGSGIRLGWSRGSASWLCFADTLADELVGIKDLPIIEDTFNGR